MNALSVGHEKSRNKRLRAIVTLIVLTLPLMGQRCDDSKLQLGILGKGVLHDICRAYGHSFDVCADFVDCLSVSYNNTPCYEKRDYEFDQETFNAAWSCVIDHDKKLGVAELCVAQQRCLADGKSVEECKLGSEVCRQYL